MRGKAPGTPGTILCDGITPAYAGKSFCIPSRLLPDRDHPRVCGEKFNSGSMLKQMGDHPRVCGEKLRRVGLRSGKAGSPPRMRGKGIQPCNQWVRVGITPAYAGKSAHRVRRSDSMRDHPRVCGEKHTTFFVRPRKWGSPPRMRGKVTGSARAPLNARITPAYAGKSLTIQKMTTRSRDHPRVCGEKRLTAKPLPGC